MYDVLRCQRHIHENHRLADHLEYQGTMYGPLGYMQDGGLGDDVFFALLAQVDFHLGVELGDVQGIGALKMQLL